MRNSAYNEDRDIEAPLLVDTDKKTYVGPLGFVFLLLALAAGGGLVYYAFFKSDSPAPVPTSTCQNPSAFGRNGVVATTNEWATRAALDILKQGGNAIDAAAAVQFMLTLTQPQSTGIGGGFLALVYNSTSRVVHAMDAREEAPEAVESSHFCATNCTGGLDGCCGLGAINPFIDRATGGHSSGVPGTVRGVQRLLDEFGTMTLAQVMQPAIHLARMGFPMYQNLYEQIIANKNRLNLFPASRELYLSNNGEPVPLGQPFFNIRLAETYERMAMVGSEDFYTGDIARDIITAVQTQTNPATGRVGVMTMKDLADYRPVYRQPIISSYRNKYEIIGMAPVSSGGIALAQMANVMELFDIPSLKSTSPEYLHRMIDAQDLAFADRDMWVGDADYVDVPIEGLINKNYNTVRAANFTRSLQSARFAAGGRLPAGTPPGATAQWAMSPPGENSGTTHWVVIDKDRTVVSFTSTLEENMGNAVVVANRGFLLNNEMTDFSATPSDPVTGQLYANRPEGGRRRRRTALGDDANTEGAKRPRSSMTPTMVFKRVQDAEFSEKSRLTTAATAADATGVRVADNLTPYSAMGSPGGSRIIGTVFNYLMQLLDFDQCIGDATAAGRVISRNDQTLAEVFIINSTEYSPAFDTLRARDFDVIPYLTNRPLGYLQAALINDDGLYEAVADNTRLPTSLALGY